MNESREVKLSWSVSYLLDCLALIQREAIAGYMAMIGAEINMEDLKAMSTDEYMSLLIAREAFRKGIIKASDIHRPAWLPDQISIEDLLLERWPNHE